MKKLLPFIPFLIQAGIIAYLIPALIQADHHVIPEDKIQPIIVENNYEETSSFLSENEISIDPIDLFYLKHKDLEENTYDRSLALKRIIHKTYQNQSSYEARTNIIGILMSTLTFGSMISGLLYAILKENIY